MGGTRAVTLRKNLMGTMLRPGGGLIESLPFWTRISTKSSPGVKISWSHAAGSAHRQRLLPQKHARLQLQPSTLAGSSHRYLRTPPLTPASCILMDSAESASSIQSWSGVRVKMVSSSTSMWRRLPAAHDSPYCTPAGGKDMHAVEFESSIGTS